MSVQYFFEALYGQERDVLFGQIPLVVLQDERDLENTLLVAGQVFLQILERQDIFFFANFHGVSNKNDTVHTPEDQPPGSIVFDLTWDGVELDLYVISLDCPYVEGEEIEEKGSVPMGFDGNHLCLYPVVEFVVDILQIGRLATPARTVVNDFCLYLSLF